MRKLRFTKSQIISILNEGDAGKPLEEVWRKYGVSSATFYKWKTKHGGLDVSQTLTMIEPKNRGRSPLVSHKIANGIDSRY